MEIETDTVSSATLLVYSTNVVRDEETDLIEDIARHCRATDIRFINSENLDDHLEGAFNWFLIIVGWTAAPDELEIVANFRKVADFAPILVIAGANDNDARAQAFNAGVDNYISVGASNDETASKARRLRSVADMARIAEAPMTFGDLSIWLRANIVMNEQKPIFLSRRELAILICIAKRSPNVVTRAQIEMEALGLRHDPGTNVVAVHIHRIRQKIGKGKNKNLIQSIPGEGYRLSCK